MVTFKITVRDTCCGIKGRFEEEMEVHTQQEAAQWTKQFKQEYPKDSGYSVKVTKIAA